MHKKTLNYSVFVSGFDFPESSWDNKIPISWEELLTVSITLFEDCLKSEITFSRTPGM